MHTWPLLRNLPVTAIFAPTSGSASGKTINGAWPPSSRLTRFIWSAQPRISCLPTSVEPVKLILRTDGVLQELVADLLGRADDQIGARPAGKPASTRHSKTWMRHKRRLAGRLADDGAAGGESRGDLAGLQRDREIPRADGADHADGMLDGHVPLARRRVGDDLAVGALALLGEPLEGIGGVQHFGPGLGNGLPCSIVSVRAMASARSRISSAVFFRILARSQEVSFIHDGMALPAASRRGGPRRGRRKRPRR